MVETSGSTTSATDLDALIRDRVDAMVAARVDELFAVKEAERAAKPKKLAIIATKGTLDWAYPPLILATTAPVVSGTTTNSQVRDPPIPCGVGLRSLFVWGG